ncbi:3-dehydroquinate synthase [Robiginitalea sp. M366]|uniref:3-dehydroquinate synthase n=1 Tax=Robiginitalea aestuariiviva TaxID=3036903 RepID=UPI00240E1ED1|nr:3-dehydroquinate synthase [Robiginitalea aestuariiviva]MDG1572987.1 3-dehydroquinate synthase [Robiginitalea aestuariiviva]
MTPIHTPEYDIYFGENGAAALKDHLRQHAYSKVFLLVDSHTEKDCLPRLKVLLPEAAGWPVFSIPAGEPHKHIHTCLEVWKALSAQGADRKSLLINLGGGVVTDLGGFVAATYMRGIPFIHIPTTLLSMVDASVGGKTGVDLEGLKNQVGVIVQPEMVWIESGFLATLPEREVRSGFAEMLKHGLICDAPYWDSLRALEAPATDMEQIRHSVELKNRVVLEDPNERNVRKILNFGHTLGHAIETYFLGHPSREALLHGEAIAVGMVLEAFLSIAACGLDPATCADIKTTILRIYGQPAILKEDEAPILKLLVHDKKNAGGRVLFTLLENAGVARFDCEVPAESLHQAFQYYRE